ncbi:MAG: YibE/F family protein [Oscillospiraceae bacterium]|nr:YibE/F family protein [Oscillospiraceae bacterium]
MTENNKEQRNKHLWLYVMTVLLSAAILLFGWKYIRSLGTLQGDTQLVPLKAQVVTVLDRQIESDAYLNGDTIDTVHVIFSAKILDNNGQSPNIMAIQTIDGYLPSGMKEVESGDIVLLYKGLDPSSPEEYSFGDYWRIDMILGLLAVFCVALLIFGHIKGANTIVSMIFTIGAVFAVFVPSILAGCNIYVWSISVCLYIIVMTLLIVNGWNAKTLTAALGCFGGVVLAGILTYLMSNLLHLTGVVNEQSIYLTSLSVSINLKALIFAAIIIGAVGAIMDVAMSISAALHELCIKVEQPTFSLLLKSGITIGRDMIGTMANTLVLAYIGSSLSVVVLLMAYQPHFNDLFNREMIVVEVLQALVGSIGILASIPLTSVLGAWLFPKPKQGHTVINSANQPYNPEHAPSPFPAQESPEDN